MKKLLTSTFLGVALLTGPVEMGAFNHQKIIEDIQIRTRNLLELRQKQDYESKLRQIQNAIDNDIDSKETRVLLIGVSEYRYLNSIRGARSDVKEMRLLFRKKYHIPSKHIYTIKDKRATKGNILGMISRVSAETPDDKKIIIYYSGHGISLDSRGREAKQYIGDYEGYVCTYDSDYTLAKKRNIKNNRTKKIRIYSKSTTISKTEIDNMVRKKQKVLIIVDACYAGAMTKNLTKNETIVAASNNEIAIGYKRSLFSGVIMDVISSGNIDSLGEAVIAAPAEMTKQASGKSAQNPLVETKDFKYDIKTDRYTEKK